MGGRGGSSGFSSSDGVIQNAKPRTIESFYREGRMGLGGGYYKKQVLEAKTDGKGNVTFSYATPDTSNQSSRRTTDLTYNLKAGAVDGEVFGINWSNVKSVSGQTYGIKSAAKENGLKWDSKTKTWRR